MFDRSSYCKDCARMTLGADKIEEMISMTENQEKKALRFPKRAALVAAALAGALCLTAAAAEVPAVQEFFSTVFVTISTNGDVTAGLSIPNVSVEEREGRSILTVDGEETDVTDALARDGKYLYEGDGFEVEVDEHGEAIVTAYGSNGTTVTYTVGGEVTGGVVYNVTSEDENGQPTTFLTSDDDEDAVSWGEYNVVVDKSGAMDVSPAGE